MISDNLISEWFQIRCGVSKYPNFSKMHLSEKIVDFKTEKNTETKKRERNLDDIEKKKM